ncbi:MAG: cysteine desulfurase family protein, partial [Candidatus Eiseniibacteriota bacterium]
MSAREIYADHAATTRTAAEVIREMSPYFAERFGNASSVHTRGEAARAAVDHARRQLAALLSANAEEMVFTASGSEANNLALKGVMLSAGGERRRLVISAIEHPSVIETARHLESRGCALTMVPVERNGVLDPDRLSAALGPDVALVSVMWVNNEIGTIQPVAELARRAHAAGARFHSDAVQAAGKLAIDVAQADVDLLSIAAHKFHGPPGAGALWIRRGLKLIPLVHGGEQERGRRAGTENLPAIVGLGAAAERAAAKLARGEGERLSALGGKLLARLLQVVPGAALNGDLRARVCSIVNLRLPGVDGEAVLHELDREGILVSTGSACSAA